MRVLAGLDDEILLSVARREDLNDEIRRPVNTFLRNTRRIRPKDDDDVRLINLEGAEVDVEGRDERVPDLSLRDERLEAIRKLERDVLMLSSRCRGHDESSLNQLVAISVVRKLTVLLGGHKLKQPRVVRRSDW